MINLEHYRDEIMQLIECNSYNFEEACRSIYEDFGKGTADNDIDECISWLLEEYEEPKELLTDDEKSFIYLIMSVYDKDAIKTYSVAKFGSVLDILILYNDNTSNCISIPLKGTLFGSRLFKKLQPRKRYDKAELDLTL